MKSFQSPFEIPKYFKKREKMISKIPTVKEMENEGKALGSIEYSLLSVAILRKLGFPTAIVYSIFIDSIFQHPTEHKNEGGHAVNLVYYNGSWWLHDSTGTVSSPTKFIFTQILQKGLIPGIIVRDLADIGIKDRFDEYYYALYNVKDVLLLDLQEDITDQIKMLKLKSYIKRFEEQVKR